MMVRNYALLLPETDIRESCQLTIAICHVYSGFMKQLAVMYGESCDDPMKRCKRLESFNLAVSIESLAAPGAKAILSVNTLASSRMKLVSGMDDRS